MSIIAERLFLPLLRQRPNLGCQLGVVLVGAALPGFDQRQKSLCSGYQIIIDLFCPLAALEDRLPIDADALGEGHEPAGEQIVLRAAEGGLRPVAQFFQLFLEGLTAFLMCLVVTDGLTISALVV